VRGADDPPGGLKRGERYHGTFCGKTSGWPLSDFGALDFPDAFWLIPLHRRERGAPRRQTGREVLRLTTHGAGLPWSAAYVVET